MDMTLRILRAFAVLLRAGCATVGPNADATAWNDARQLVLVTTADWEATTGTLRTFDRGDDGAWHEAGKAAPVSIGRGGSGWGIGLHPAQTGGPAKREGDGRAPAGVFTIGEAFGYARSEEHTLNSSH